MYPYYWRSDIGEMAHLIETAQDAINDKGTRDEGLQAFMQHRVAMMERMSKVTFHNVAVSLWDTIC